MQQGVFLQQTPGYAPAVLRVVVGNSSRLFVRLKEAAQHRFDH
jgi:hypothetical protein